MARVVVVGGGISGLALAFRLEELAGSLQVTVLEKRPRLGGTIGTEVQAGFRFEIGPNGFLDNHPSTWNLCRDVGLGDRLIPASESARRNRFLYLRGQLHKLPTGLFSLLTSRVLSWRSKWALLTERFRKPRRDAGDESVDAFARRRTSDEIAETLADAFVTGIHAADPALLSVRAAFPRLAELEAEHGSVTGGLGKAARKRRQEAKARGEPVRRGLRTWSFREGLGLLIDTLRARLRGPVLTGVSVRRLEPGREGATWLVRGEGQESWPVDAVVLACPAHEQSAILADLDSELAQATAEIPYNRVAVVVLGFRRREVSHPLDGFGYLTPGRDRRDVLGVQWCSSIFPNRAPEGMVLLRAMCGGWFRPEMLDWDDDRLLSAVRQELGRTLQITAVPVFHRIVRWDRAIPQYHLGHLERVARIQALASRHRHLFLAGNCYRGVAMNDCVEQAGLLARRVVEALRPPGVPAIPPPNG